MGTVLHVIQKLHKLYHIYCTRITSPTTIRTFWPFLSTSVWSVAFITLSIRRRLVPGEGLIWILAVDVNYLIISVVKGLSNCGVRHVRFIIFISFYNRLHFPFHSRQSSPEFPDGRFPNGWTPNENVTKIWPGNVIWPHWGVKSTFCHLNLIFWAPVDQLIFFLHTNNAKFPFLKILISIIS